MHSMNLKNGCLCPCSHGIAQLQHDRESDKVSEIQQRDRGMKRCTLINIHNIIPGRPILFQVLYYSEPIYLEIHNVAVPYSASCNGN
jgi:hypothetical protein